MINKRPGRSLKESQPYYPKRGCCFAKHNLSTACYDRVSKLEQLCKIYAACEFFPGLAALGSPCLKPDPSLRHSAQI